MVEHPITIHVPQRTFYGNILKFHKNPPLKYKVKDGFENEFVEALNGYDYSKSVVAKAISIGDNEYVSISEYDSIDAIGDDEVTGLEWLDNVTHMLEYFGESRTQSYSGLVIMDTNRKTTSVS